MKMVTYKYDLVYNDLGKPIGIRSNLYNYKNVLRCQWILAIIDFSIDGNTKDLTNAELPMTK